MPKFEVNDLVMPTTFGMTLYAVIKYLKFGVPYRVTRLDSSNGIHLQEMDGTDVPNHNYWNSDIFVLYQQIKTFILNDTGE